MNTMLVSIIIPVYNEQENLRQLNTEIFAALDKKDYKFEVIYVDDGSTDNSFQGLKDIATQTDSMVTVIRLTHNFGQTQAIAAGIDTAKGDIVILMDADLQNDPSDINKMIDLLCQGYDVVSGWRKNRKDALFSRRIPSYIANILISKLTGVVLKDYGCTLKAYKSKWLKQIKLSGNMHRFIPAYLAMNGAKITEIEINHRRRAKGESKYNISRIFEVILDLCALKFFWSYIGKPIYVFGGAGILSIIIAFITAIIIIARHLFFGGIWVSPLLFLFVLFFIMGVQFILMGILAELLIRLCNKESSRLYRVETIIRKEGNKAY